ncbi:MAG TPA: hypothetical protein VF735_00620 [Pyrinomonadaceae bacterium]|jgi:hypothetical protein
MKLKLTYLALALAACVLFAFGYWRYTVSKHRRPSTYVVILHDTSDSTPEGCGRVVGLAEQVLSSPDFDHISTITVLGTGDATTANEPRLLGEFRIPEIRRVIEGKRAAVRQRDELFSNLRSRCEETGQTTVSPIFMGVKRAVERLQSIKSGDDRKLLIVETDGEETSDLQIKRALDEAPGVKLRLPNAIQNDNTHIVICGLAETLGEVRGADGKVKRMTKLRSPQRADRMLEVWKGLFTNPDLVSLKPYCQETKNQVAASVP